MNNQQLVQKIVASVYTNGEKAVNAASVQEALLSIVETLGGNSYAGEATPTTNPGNPDAKVFYVAKTTGNYTSFGSGISLTAGEVAIIAGSGNTWAKTTLFSGSYNDLQNKPVIPSKTSELENDSEFVEGSNLSAVATSGSYDDLTEKPTALPNPNSLTFTGAVSGSYNGSSPVTINIPSGGGGTPGVWFHEGTDATENILLQPIFLEVENQYDYLTIYVPDTLEDGTVCFVHTPWPFDGDPEREDQMTVQSCVSATNMSPGNRTVVHSKIQKLDGTNASRAFYKIFVASSQIYVEHILFG